MDCENKTLYLLRSSSCVFLEELDKCGRAGKIEPVRDLLDRHVCCLEKHLRFDQHRLMKPIKHRPSSGLLDSCR